MKLLTKVEKRMAAVVAVVLVVLAVTSFAKAACMEYTTKEVVVREGDTLWSIWEEVGHGRADKWIGEVRDMNHMKSADLAIGDKLIIPVMKGE